MRFFEQQRIDLIGQTGVSLQKILLFFMILSALTLFNGGLLSFIVCTIGFVGAVKRNPRMLAFYYTITIAFILVFFFFSLFSYTYAPTYTDSSSSEFSSNEVIYVDTEAPTQTPTQTPYNSESKSFARNLMRRVYTPESSSQSSSSSSSSSDSYYEELTTVAIAIGIFEIFFYFFVSYLKVKSLVLAYRMRLLIISQPILPVDAKAEDHSEQYPAEQCANEHEQSFTYAPKNTKCVDDEPQYHQEPAAAEIPQPAQFTQPGYMPFAPVPMQYPGGPAMVPPPMMYGQFPVYYSFAPAPSSPASAPRDEKL